MIEEKERELRQKVSEIDQLERQLGCVNQQLEESEHINAQTLRRIAELDQLRPATDTSSIKKEQRTSIKLTWWEGEKAPCKMSIPRCTAVNGSTLYFKVRHQIFSYTISTSTWSPLPRSCTKYCPSVIVNNLLTLVGGFDRSDITTNKLFSLTGEGSGRRWTEELPPMLTKRHGSIALCTETALIVAGGADKDGSTLQTVEVLNTEALQWSTAAHLPQPLYQAPAAVCGDQVYILGRSIMYTSSVSAIIQSRQTYLPSTSARAWKAVAAPLVKETTCVSIRGRLLTIGGKYSDKKPTAVIHMYSPITDSWEVISHMGTPRYDCIAAVLPNNQLMVVGGYVNIDGFLLETDSVEFATVL